MWEVRYADRLPHERARPGRISVSVRKAVSKAVGRRRVAFGLGIQQLLDGHALPQVVQGQDGLHGRDALCVLLHEGLAILGAILQALVEAGRGRHHGQGLAVLELFAGL